MMDLREVKPVDAIESSWLEEYERRMNVLWWELVRLNSNLYILDKLLDFPFDLFLPMPDQSTFFNIVLWNLFEFSILTAWKLVEDTLTLRSCKNEIRQHMRSKFKSGFDAALKETKFERQIERLVEPVKTLGDKRIAHLDRDFNLSSQQVEEMRVSLSDLRVLRDALNQLFEVLCFGHERRVLPIEYHPEVVRPPGVDARSDIEKLLDNIARDSPLLNMPENEPDRWSYFRQGLSGDVLQVLNEYRKKSGKPEV